MSKSKSKLPAEVAEKYDLVDWPSKTSFRIFFGHKFGYVDLNTITLARADRLYRLGFLKLRLKTEVRARANPKAKDENCKDC